MRITNWGKYPVAESTLAAPRSQADTAQLLRGADTAIGRGMGRCYGDSSLAEPLIISSRRLDRMLDFNPATGRLAAEAGVTLSEILDAFAPRGWFPPVTPGTRFVSLGGAIASDVHGKNHHVSGCFGQHTAWVDLVTAGGETVRCSPELEPELFAATHGGHGLTGFIAQAAVDLVPIQSAYIRQETVKAANLGEIMDAFEQSGGWTYSVAWIDCAAAGSGLGRSVLMRGEHARPDELGKLPAKLRAAPLTLPPAHTLSIPVDFPSFVLNPWSVKAFNMLYYGKAHSGVSESIVPYTTFFYPLDAVNEWNRIYGKRGFTQYQFVIPKEAGRAGLEKILARIAASGLGSFLAVLKLFGRQDHPKGNMSFPMEGYTLALDFPIGEKLFPLLDTLDAMVLDYGGRLYLTKDARMSAETFRRGYGALLDDFLAVKQRWDPQWRLQSLQSRRLGLARQGGM
ncbi:MAG: hypothetical protein AUJ49_07760 [Desulfovibrionaceae bacterium CG1_02_65_16]|nr:MAG: hypothetical protein AUJ49_07760 [Desulfovibrionaceae bacterium CG1_02_65_16]